MSATLKLHRLGENWTLLECKYWISKHISNIFSKSTTTIFINRKLALVVQMADIECLRAPSTSCVAPEDMRKLLLAREAFQQRKINCAHSGHSAKKNQLGG